MSLLFLKYFLTSGSPTLFLHLPRSHYENPACPHWLRCLDVSQKAMPVIQLCAMAPDITGLNSLTCFPLYLIGMVWLQEWRLRGDRLGLLRNSIEYCSLVLQKLSERWASAGIPPEPAPDFVSFVPILLNPFYVFFLPVIVYFYLSRTKVFAKIGI